MRKILVQFFKFVGISGIGWLIDFTIYTLLTTVFNVPVFYANCISAVPAVTLVFLVSTKKIFQKSHKLPLIVKYIVYLLYQFVLLVFVSSVCSWLADWIIASFNGQYDSVAKIAAKILITPITMIMNFFVMKIMVEKV